ncbi:MAG: methyltransferase [Candidatus Woesearchaeota archaeon]|nr:MAG: methyltransferase [Candidatus Woesearchaeota archaeon]
MISKKQLEITLSKLKDFEKPNVSLEQYTTTPEIASEILNFALLNNDIKDKVIADLGCGNGILGIGSLLLGAKKVFFLDKDKDAIKLTKNNLKAIEKEFNIKFKKSFLNKDVFEFNQKVDVVTQNPPFGVQKKHADKPFLEKALSISNKIYSIHKIESEKFIKELAQENNFKLEKIIPFTFPLKPIYRFHKEHRHRVYVGCFVLSKV